jgi:7-cyano-7-deazaguanine synthase
MKICEKLGVQIQWIKYPFGKYLHSNLLKGGGDIPEGEYKDLSMKQTVVPFRNAIMLSLAVGIAESNGYERVSLAVHSGDHFIYPDCRPEFIDNIRKAIGCGTDAGIELFAPYVTYTKAEIIHEGYSMGVPFKETWTCYKGGERHCGICGSCDERKKSFIEAGIKDPTDYID